MLRRTAFILPALALSACATMNPPDHGQTQFVQAKPEPEKPVPRIQRIPKPVPSPQLRQMPAGSKASDQCNAADGTRTVYDVIYTAPSAKAADDAVTTLKAQGFHDLFRDAHNDRLIYLGRYNARSYAERRTESIANKTRLQARVSQSQAQAGGDCHNLGQAAIHAANDDARRQSSTQGFVAANQVFTYQPGVLYQIWARPGYVTSIELQPGEQLVSKAAGDTSRWVIGQTLAGTGDDKRTLILIKPVRKGLRTNMVFTTNRRVYTIEASATDGPYNSIVSWHYPQDSFDDMVTQTRQATADQNRVVGENINPTNLNFDYNIETTSDTGVPVWKPTSVFDDGHKTYIKFPANLGTTRAPPLFVIQRNGDASLVNYRIKNNYYVVDQLFSNAELRIGRDPQIIVRISRQRQRSGDQQAANASRANSTLR